MGGEQQAVLVYGPKKSYDYEEFVDIFQLIDKKEWVKNFLENEQHTYEDPYDENDLEGIEIIFDQEFMDSLDRVNELVTNFLKTYGLSIVFSDNCSWSEFNIGFIVNDYELFNFSSVKTANNKFNMKTVKEFCEKYNLQKPTYFAGIIGEYE